MKIFFAFVLSIFSAQSIDTAAHPLYVSITEISYNSSEKSIEVISKIYLDDLEDAIKKKYGKKIDLFADATTESKQLMLQYMQSCLQINVDGSNRTYSIVGYERKKDACWAYLEAVNVNTFKTVKITNNILHDFTTKQINMITVANGDNSKSHKFNYPDKEKSFSF